MTRPRIVALCTLCVVAMAPVAAAESTLNLSALVTRDATGLKGDQASYARLVRDLGASVRPGAGPAATPGTHGLHIGIGYGQTDLDEHATQWTRTTQGTPESSLAATSLRVVKGLPLSMTLGGELLHLAALDGWAPSLFLGWAFVEGLDGLPDVASRLHVGTLLGQRDVTLIHAGADLTVSYPIALAGLFRVTPYLDYALTVSHGGTRPLAVVEPSNVQVTEFVLDAETEVVHQATLGLAVSAYPVEAGFEVSLGDATSIRARLTLTL